MTKRDRPAATLFSETTPAPDKAALLALESRSRAVAEVLKALANQKRLLMLAKLAAIGEVSVGDLAFVAGVSQSAVSQHLARLREQGIVNDRRSGQTVYYAIADSQVERLLSALIDIYCPDFRQGA